MLQESTQIVPLGYPFATCTSLFVARATSKYLSPLSLSSLPPSFLSLSLSHTLFLFVFFLSFSHICVLCLGSCSTPCAALLRHALPGARRSGCFGALNSATLGCCLPHHSLFSLFSFSFSRARTLGISPRQPTATNLVFCLSVLLCLPLASCASCRLDAWLCMGRSPFFPLFSPAGNPVLASPSPLPRPPSLW